MCTAAEKRPAIPSCYARSAFRLMLNCQPCRNPNCMFSRQILGEPGLVDYSERSELCEICDNREERLQDCIRSLALLWILDALGATSRTTT